MRLSVLLCGLLVCSPLAVASGLPVYASYEVVTVEAGWAAGPILVPGYSVPSLADWNQDGLVDLIVGEGGGLLPAKVRVYENTGSPGAPRFEGFSYVQSGGGDLTGISSGCMGLFPRALCWDADDRKDLLIGQADGYVRLYRNVGSATAAVMDAGTYLQFGPLGAKSNIRVSGRATPTLCDWNQDGRRDLLVGEYSGKVRIYLNEGTDHEPDFRTEAYVQSTAGDLLVGAYRSSPELADVDQDGLRDLVCGDTRGRLLTFLNEGTDSAPVFAAAPLLACVGDEAIDIGGSAMSLRSRPFLCDWNEDGALDALVGAGDGRVHLYVAVPEPATGALLLAFLLLAPRARRRGGTSD